MKSQVHAILPIIREWFENAKTGEVSVFNFPPMKRPAKDHIRKLSIGSICLLFLYDDRLLSGEFKVANVRRVHYEEFNALKKRAFETREARFPKRNEWCWVIEFTDFRVFRRPLSEDELRQVFGEVYGKSASMRPLHFTQVIDEKLVNTVKTIILVLQFMKDERKITQ